MATLNANNRVLTLYSNDHNVALCLNSQTIVKLGGGDPSVECKSCTEPYMGLRRHCSALSPNGRWYAVVAEKNLIVWATDDWHRKCEKRLARSASQITFSPSNDEILVADKTGDVYSYSVNEDGASASGRLLFGHLSILLDVLVTPDEKYVLTCDRDEKIRVTRYPNTHNIQCFCLGHSAFVTKLVLLKGDVLLSGSGDGTLKFWRYAKGECLASYSVANDVVLNPETYCIITNIAAFEESDRLVTCVSVFKRDGLLVYTCRADRNYEMSLAQRINCCEPLDFVSYDSLLWILEYSTSCLLKAFSWDRTAQKYGEAISPDVNDTCAVLNDNCFSLAASSIDLSVLYKKFDLKEKSLAKKVRVG